MCKDLQGPGGSRTRVMKRVFQGGVIFFVIFENGQYAAGQVFFMSPIPKSLRIWPQFQKITWTFTNKYFLKVCEILPFTSKNNRQKECFFLFFLGPQNGLI